MTTASESRLAGDRLQRWTLLVEEEDGEKSILGGEEGGAGSERRLFPDSISENLASVLKRSG